MSEINRLDTDRRCEHCNTLVLNDPERLFGILQNCEHVFCYTCALTFWTIDQHSDNEPEVYLKCPVCHIKSYRGAASNRLFERRENKKAYFDEHFKFIKDLPCEFCLKEKGNCIHGKKCTLNLDIDKSEPLSELKFDDSSFQLYSPHVVPDCSSGRKYHPTHNSSNVSDLSSNLTQPVQWKSIGSGTASELDSSKTGIFSEEDFPPLGDSNRLVTKTEPSEEKPKKSSVDLSADFSYQNKRMKNLFKERPKRTPILSPLVVYLPSKYNNPLPPANKLENASPLPFLPEIMPPEYPAELSTCCPKRKTKIDRNKYIRNLYCPDRYNDFCLLDDIPLSSSSSSNHNDNLVDKFQSMKLVPSSSKNDFKAENGEAFSGRSYQTSSSISNIYDREVPLVESNTKITPSFQNHARKSQETLPQASNSYIQNINMNYGWLQGCNETQIRNYSTKTHRLNAFPHVPGNVDYQRPQTMYDFNQTLGSIDINHSHCQDNVSKREEPRQSELQMLPINSSFNLQNNSFLNNWTLNQHPVISSHDSSRYFENQFSDTSQFYVQTMPENYLQREPVLYALMQTNPETQRENVSRISHNSFNNQIESSYRNFTNSNFHDINQTNLHQNLNQFHQIPSQSWDVIPVNPNNQIEIASWNQFPNTTWLQSPTERSFQLENNYYFQLQRLYRNTYLNFRRHLQTNYPYYDQINFGYQIHTNVQGYLEENAGFPYRYQTVYRSSNSEEASDRPTRYFDDVFDQNRGRPAEK